jgi:hypothetical protein
MVKTEPARHLKFWASEFSFFDLLVLHFSVVSNCVILWHSWSPNLLWINLFPRPHQVTFRVFVQIKKVDKIYVPVTRFNIKIIYVTISFFNSVMNHYYDLANSHFSNLQFSAEYKPVCAFVSTSDDETLRKSRNSHARLTKPLACSFLYLSHHLAYLV